MPGEKLGIGVELKHIKMKELPVCERPYDKCKLYGPQSLSDEELLAIFLRSGTRDKRVSELARDVINLAEDYGGLSYFPYIPEDELLGISGLGPVKIILLKCLFEFDKRLSRKKKISGITRIESPKDAVEVMEPELSGLEIEEVWALYLDGRNGLIRKEMITKGTSNSSMISVKDIFKEALRCNATGVFLFHNHPSGDPTPSLQDIGITRQVKQSSLLMGIDFVDHVIIGGNKYISLKEKGYI